MPERNMKTVLHIAGTEFKRWLRSSRIIILGVMLIFVHMQIIVTLQDCASRTGLPVSVPEAFVALGNSGSIVLILPALFLVLMSDFPQKSGIDFLYQIRCSKRVWIMGQIMFALEAVVFLVVFLILASCLMMGGSGVWKMEFSNAVTHYSSIFPERTGDYILQLHPGKSVSADDVSDSICAHGNPVVAVFFLTVHDFIVYIIV